VHHKGTPGADFLKGTSANDVICGKGGSDILVDYKGGADTLLGNGGKDVLLDVKGKGMLKGGDESDVLFALDDVPLNTMNGQAGTDWCVGDRGDVRKNCERGSLLGLSAAKLQRLEEAKDAAGL
jgi:Ca2+-binding RTX toxin-like protein